MDEEFQIGTEGALKLSIISLSEDGILTIDLKELLKNHPKLEYKE